MSSSLRSRATGVCGPYDGRVAQFFTTAVAKSNHSRGSIEEWNRGGCLGGRAGRQNNYRSISSQVTVVSPTIDALEFGGFSTPIL